MKTPPQIETRVSFEHSKQGKDEDELDMAIFFMIV